MDRLRPHPNSDSQPYWDGLAEGRLMLQRCADCAAARHYPRPVCGQCYSMAVDWIEATGHGVVHSWTISHHAFHPSFKSELPLALVTVDLDEGVRLCAPLRGGDAGALAVGQPVQVGVERIDAELVIPVVSLESPDSAH